MRFIILFIALFILISLSSITYASQQIIDYSDDKRNDSNYVQPVYFMYPEFDKCRLEYASEYDVRRKYFADDLRAPVATDPEQIILPLYLHARQDMHPDGSPENYFLLKNSPLRINLIIDKMICENMSVTLKVPEQFYFTINADVIDMTRVNSSQQSQFSLKDIRLQKLQFHKLQAKIAKDKMEKLLYEFNTNTVSAI